MYSLRSADDGFATGRENRIGGGGDFILFSLGARYVRITERPRGRGYYRDLAEEKRARQRARKLPRGDRIEPVRRQTSPR